jgi:hypothetical protein
LSAPLADDLLVAPVPQATVERIFSVCGWFTAGRRYRLSHNLEIFLKLNNAVLPWTCWRNSSWEHFFTWPNHVNKSCETDLLLIFQYWQLSEWLNSFFSSLNFNIQSLNNKKVYNTPQMSLSSLHAQLRGLIDYLHLTVVRCKKTSEIKLKQKLVSKQKTK